MIEVRPLPLPLRHAFRIAHGSSTERTNALVRLGEGFGEAALPPYYPTRITDVNQWVQHIRPLLDAVLARSYVPVTSILEALPNGPSPARAAVDMALHDLWGKRSGLPVYALYGLDPEAMPVSSYAVPIPQDRDELNRMLDEVATFPFLKLKIGSGDPAWDEDIVRITRQRFDGTLCVDVNAHWSIDTTVRMVDRLQDLDLAFIEQPIPASHPDDWHLLRRMMPSCPVPLIADESVQGPDDVIALAGAADGINIKLAKCGGILAARGLVALARSLDMQVMLGCMIESSVAMTAAAHLGPLADWLDLDGPMHLKDDPFSGMTFQQGIITLPDGPGLGVIPRNN
ncbi:MAG: dipeptide epimerase [Bacteroidetes bacterium]|nr:dipeptide epimerase [Bacteroidota bacterium]MDA0874057.1 dipeptide epimerase [Bacteroidota bacterium]